MRCDGDVAVRVCVATGNPTTLHGTQLYATGQALPGTVLCTSLTGACIHDCQQAVCRPSTKSALLTYTYSLYERQHSWGGTPGARFDVQL